MSNARLSRRDLLRDAAALGIAVAGAASLPSRANSASLNEDRAIDIGSRRELFVDDALIAGLAGGIQQRLHQPTPRELSLAHDAPWEGTGSGYHSVFQDGAQYRMYYKAWNLDVSERRLDTSRHPLYCCYAESSDGIHWEKPSLGLVEFAGARQNNIVLASGKRGMLDVDAGHPAVFKDDNPAAAEDASYKAIFRSSNPNGLLPFKSPDGLRWSPMTEAPILGGLGAFDSQNLAFWDPTIAKYRAYWRIFKGGRRDIRTAVSDDLMHWEPHVDLKYGDAADEQLYTNQVKPYHRAPHVLIGFPTRYVDRGWSESMRALPEREHRELRASAVERYGTALTEGLLMASRDGVNFKRYGEAFLPPGVQRPGSWHYGQQYIAWHVVETACSLPGAPSELSLYAGESYWTGEGSALRRYTLRLDGFVSLYAPLSGGELVTRPFTFSGSTLTANFATSAAGGMRVEMQDIGGNPIPGFALGDCPEAFGDEIERRVAWNAGSDVSRLAGKPVRLRIELKDAHLYSFRFGQSDA